VMQGVAKNQAFRKAQKALARLAMADKNFNLPGQLSGGQQQRVAIARAIAHDPYILFADEPTANLDSANSQMVLEAFLELNKNGQTIVMVTHEEDYAHQAKRIVTLKDGLIVADYAVK